ncbi:MAG: RAD55 family ATPase [Nanoarchaeota archaeon]|nr:RAD55 family ATPase [Nanoarchaeota archaeon]
MVKKKRISKSKSNSANKKSSKKKMNSTKNKSDKIKPEKKGFLNNLENLFHSDNSEKQITKKEDKKPEIKTENNNPKKKIEKVINKLKKDVSEKILRKKKESKEVEKKKFSEGYMLTGIKGFDSLFEKGMGIPNGAAVLVEGGPGSGKTVFCLAAANELCKKGKKCLYMSFEESEEQLTEHMEKFNWKAKDFVKKGLLRITRFDAIDVSRSIEALLSAAKKELLIEVEPMFFPDDFKPDFVVIDSLTSIASAFSGEESRFRIYMEQLFRYLEKNKITNFLIREVSSPSHVGSTFTEQGEAVSFLSDGIIVIYNIIYDSGGRTSAIEILKMRGVSFKKRIVEFKIINGKGLEVNPDKILKKTGANNFSLT